MSRVKRGRGRDPIEQAMELALRLGGFIGYGASWEFVSRLERGAVKALTKKGLSAFASQVRARFDAADPAKAREDGRDNGYHRRYWGDALKTVYAAQRDVDSYASLCKETELVPLDGKILAGILQSRHKPEMAARVHLCPASRGSSRAKSFKLVRLSATRPDRAPKGELGATQRIRKRRRRERSLVASVNCTGLAQVKDEHQLCTGGSGRRGRCPYLQPALRDGLRTMRRGGTTRIQAELMLNRRRYQNLFV